MTDAILSEYLVTANNAAHLERKGQFELAEKCWLNAAFLALKKENMQWAECRADSCEKKKLRPPKK